MYKLVVGAASLPMPSFPITNKREETGQQFNANLSHVAEIIALMARGEKISSNETDWPFRLAVNMRSAGALNENHEEYFTTPHHTPGGITEHSPVSYNLWAYKDDLKCKGANLSLQNILVFGWRGRKLEMTGVRQDFNTADFLVLSSVGDLFSVHRFLQFINTDGASNSTKKRDRVLKYIDRDSPSSKTKRQPKVLIVENVKDHYGPLLSALFGQPGNNETSNIFYESKLQELFDARKVNVKVKFSHGLEHTLEVCFQEKHRINLKNLSFNQILKLKSYTGPLVESIFVASTSDKKLEEAGWLFGRQHVTSLQDLIGVFPEAQEKHITYEGNAIGTDKADNTGKAYTIINHLQSIWNDPANGGKKKMLTNKMEQLGFNPKDPINIYLDDRGVEFPNAVMPYVDKTNMKNVEIHKYKPEPGPETTYVVQAEGGMEQFANTFNAAFAAADAAYFAGKERKQIPREVRQVCVSVIVRYTLMTGKYEILSGWGDSKCEFLQIPRMGKDKKLDEHHWLVPKDVDNPDSLSGGEYGYKEFVKNYSAQGRGARVVSALFRADLAKDKREKERIENYTICYAGNGKPEEAVMVSDSPGMERMISTHGIDIGSLKRANSPIATQIGPGLQGFNQWIEGKDAVVFNARHGLPKSELAFLLISTAVAKQLDPRCREILLAIDRSAPDLDRLCQVLSLGDDLAYIKERASTLFTGFYSANTTEDELAKLTSSHLDNYRRIELDVTLQGQESDDFIDFRSALNTGRPAAFICCSAGSINPKDNDEIFATVENLCENGHDIYYGGGDKFMMGQVLNAVNAWNNLCLSKKDPDVGPERVVKLVGISTPGIAARETAHGMPEGIISHLCATIHGRMLNLIGNSDRLIALNGGAGTIQEILAFAKLKEEKSEYTLGKSMTVINNEVVIGKPRLYEPLLEYYGDGDREAGRQVLAAMNIHVEDGIQLQSRRLQAHATEPIS